MIDGHRSAVVGGATVAVLAAVLGACLGGWASRFVPPTNADVRTAARSLVPPGVSVVSVTARNRGGFPVRGPYGASVKVLGPEIGYEERVRTHQEQADRSDWQLDRAEAFPNGEVLHHRRSGISATGSVFRDVPEALIRTRRINDSRIGPLLVCSLLGAASVGLGVWLLLGRGRHTPSRRDAGGAPMPQVPPAGHLRHRPPHTTTTTRSTS